MEIKKTTADAHLEELIQVIRRTADEARVDIECRRDEAVLALRERAALGQPSDNIGGLLDGLHGRSVNIFVQTADLRGVEAMDGVYLSMPRAQRRIVLDEPESSAFRFPLPSGRYRFWLFVEPVAPLEVTP